MHSRHRWIRSAPPAPSYPSFVFAMCRQSYRIDRRISVNMSPGTHIEPAITHLQQKAPHFFSHPLSCTCALNQLVCTTLILYHYITTCATGKTGKLVVEGLLRRGKAVRAVTRSGDFSIGQDTEGGLATAAGDVTKIDTLKQALAGCGAVLFCASASKVGHEEYSTMSRGFHTDLRCGERPDVMSDLLYLCAFWSSQRGLSTREEGADRPRGNQRRWVVVSLSNSSMDIEWFILSTHGSPCSGQVKAR